MGSIKLLLLKSDTDAYDISDLVHTVTWSGRKGAAPRSLTVKILDDDGAGHGRAGIDCEKGNRCIFYWEDNELFRGVIMQHSQDEGKMMSFKASDNLIYASNNKDSFSYTQWTAGAIFNDCMKRLGVLFENAPNTGFIIPELIKSKTTYWDCLEDAMSQTYKSTKNRYYVLSEKGMVKMKKRTEFYSQWVIEAGVNLISYSFSKSIEKTKTRIRLLTKEGRVIKESLKSGLEKAIGRFMEIDTPDEDLNEAQLKEVIDTMMEEECCVQKNLSIDALGVPEAISGRCVYCKIPHLGIEKSFYIDQDTHTFTGNYHKMQLKLNFAANIAAAG